MVGTIGIIGILIGFFMLFEEFRGQRLKQVKIIKRDTRMIMKK